MQRGNLFKHRKSSTKISFETALISIDDEVMCFINFLSSTECKDYILLKKYYDMSKIADFSFLDNDFFNAEFTTKNETKNSRLRSLILKTTNELLDDNQLTDIVKYKNKTKKGLQFFIKYDSDSDTGYVYLIDIYHMVIPTDHIEKNFHIKSNPKQHYKRIKQKVKNKVNLNILK